MEEAFRKEGFVKRSPVLGPDDRQQLMHDTVRSWSQETNYIIESDSRIHSDLLLSPAVTAHIHKTVTQELNFFRSWKDVYLAELASIAVFPGAAPQRLHRDTKDLEQRMLTCFTHLTGGGPGRGGFRLVPGSHRLDDASVNLHESIDVVTAPGEIIFSDGHVFHGGDGNSTESEFRCAVYFTFADFGALIGRGSIRREYSCLLTPENFFPVAASDTVTVTPFLKTRVLADNQNLARIAPAQAPLGCFVDVSRDEWSNSSWTDWLKLMEVDRVFSIKDAMERMKLHSIDETVALFRSLQECGLVVRGKVNNLDA